MHAFGAPAEAAKDLSSPLSRFLAPLISLRHSLPAESMIEPGEPALLQDLVEANVQQAVETIAATETVQANWALKGSKGVQIHGLVYHLDTVSPFDRLMLPIGFRPFSSLATSCSFSHF